MSAVVLVGDGVGVAVLAGRAVGVVPPVLLLPPDGAQAPSRRSSAIIHTDAGFNLCITIRYLSFRTGYPPGAYKPWRVS